LDMEASPYDVRPLGYGVVPIETPRGKAEYVRRQRQLAAGADALRERILAELEGLDASTPGARGDAGRAGTLAGCRPSSGVGLRSGGRLVVGGLRLGAEVRAVHHVRLAVVAEAVHGVLRPVAEEPGTAGGAAGHVAGDALGEGAADGVVARGAGAALEGLAVEGRGGRVAVGVVVGAPLAVEGDRGGADGVLEGAAAALGAHGREGDVVADVLAGDALVGGDEIGRGPGAVGGVAVVVAGHEDPVGGPGAGVVDAVPGGRDGRAVRGGDGVAGADVVLAALGEEDLADGVLRLG